MRREVDINEISDGKLYSVNDLVKVVCNDCAGCSKCCRGMGESIILDPYDVYRLCGGLELSFEQLLASYVELNVVDGIILPNLKMNKESNSCSFLNSEGRCSIHSIRPGICRMFPLGRIYNEEGFKYFIQIYECPSKNTGKVKVKKWIDTPNINQYEKYINDWHKLLKRIEEKILGEDLNVQKHFNMILLNIFFMNKYNIEEDFYVQFNERCDLFVTQYFNI